MDLGTHDFPEYSGHLLAVTPTAHWLSWMGGIHRVRTPPDQGGYALIPDRPGRGHAVVCAETAP
jgi:mandelate racemase